MKKFKIFTLLLIALLCAAVFMLAIPKPAIHLTLPAAETSLDALKMLKGDAGIFFGENASIVVVDFQKVVGAETSRPVMRIYSSHTLQFQAGEHSILIDDNGVSIDGVNITELQDQIKQLQIDVEQLK